MWECRLCGSQNDRTDIRCGVCQKGTYPRDALVAGAAAAGDPVGKRGIGAVIVPGGPGAPLPPPGTISTAATPPTPPAAAPRRGARAALIVLVVLLVLVAVAIGIALAVAGVAVPWSGPGAASLSMLFLPAVTRRPVGSDGTRPSRR